MWKKRTLFVSSASFSGLFSHPALCLSDQQALVSTPKHQNSTHAHHFSPISHIQGQTTAAEVPGGTCPSVHLIWTPVPPSLTLMPEHSQSRWGFVLAVGNTLESAEGHYDKGLELIATGDLLPSHRRSWQELWAGSLVELTGPDALSRAVIGCMFYLLSSFPSLDDDAPTVFGGVSPGGLSNGGQGQDYWGHVFWDQVRCKATVYLRI